MVKDKRNKKIAAEIIAAETDDKAGIKMVEEEMKEVESDIQQKGVLVFVNGKRISSEALKSFYVQHSDGVTVVEINYEEEQKKEVVKKTDISSDEKPSPKGISIPTIVGPEVYALGEDDFVKLCSMSALRTDKTDDKGPVSKLKKNIPNESIPADNCEVVEVELRTDENDISDVLSITKALNDLAVKEQKIQRDPKVIKVEEVYSRPKVVFTGNTFVLIERLKLYKVKELNEK
jgi:hypothetical protein